MKTTGLLAKQIKSGVRFVASRGFLKWVPDEMYLKMIYFIEMGRPLNLDNPVTYNEKLQWLKLHDRKPEYKVYVDKYEVREYVRRTVGERYLVPLIAVYDSVEDIDWEGLPEQFVLKCTHASHANVICPAKSRLDIVRAKKRLKKWLRRDWYWYGREWPYKGLRPRIICEEFLGENIIDYKFMCFNGEPRIIQVHQDRTRNHTLDFLDTSWRKTEIRRRTRTSSQPIPRPSCLDEMLRVARELSRDEIHVRIDLYEVNGRVYFGEKTFYSGSGLIPFYSHEHDRILGDMIVLNARQRQVT